VDAVQDDDGGRVGDPGGCVEARADGATGQREGEVAGGEGLGDQAVEQRRDRLAADEVQHGDGLQGVMDGRPREDREECESEQAEGGDAAGGLGHDLAVMQEKDNRKDEESGEENEAEAQENREAGVLLFEAGEAGIERFD